MRTAITLNLIGAIGLAGVWVLWLNAPEPSSADGPADVAVFERVLVTDG